MRSRFPPRGSYLRRCGHRVVEVDRGDRRSRRHRDKSDAIDAEAAARSVLAGTSTTIPKTADGLVEMIRQIKMARDTARKGRTAAIITVGAMIINAPAKLRESLDGLSNKSRSLIHAQQPTPARRRPQS